MKNSSENGFYRSFYNICRRVGELTVAFVQLASTGLSYAAGACRYMYEAVAELFGGLFDRMLKGKGKVQGGFSVARAISSLAGSFKNNTAETYEIYKKWGAVEGTKKLGRDCRSFVKAFWRFVAPILNIAVPAAAIVICVMTVRQANNFTYGIEVTFKGETIGIIEDESIFNRAVTSISTRVENATGETYYVEVDPTFEVVKVTDAKTYASPAEIEERIIANSPELFREGTGLYINGELIAVTDYKDAVNNLLDGILSQAEEKYLSEISDGAADGFTVDFVDSIRLEDGLYPVTAKLTVSEIKQLLNSKVSEEISYEIQSGDSVKAIAAKFDMTADELYALNPGLEEQKKIYVGDTLIIGSEVPYLQVKMSCMLTYEEKTEIPVEYIESSSYYQGVTKLKREGEAGINKVTAQIVYVNGVETDRIVTESVEIKEAVSKQYYKGTKKGHSISALKGEYIAPVKNARLTSPFGYRTHPVTGEKNSFHTGIDLAAAKDTPIYASRGGTVIFKGTSGNYGNLVKIDHGDGTVSYYAHCNSFASGLKVGDKVEMGETIAYVGKTGRATGYHLHFEIRYKNEAVNINKLFPEY